MRILTLGLVTLLAVSAAGCSDSAPGGTRPNPEAEAWVTEAQARAAEAVSQREVPPPPSFTVPASRAPTSREPALFDYVPFGVPQTAPRADARRVARISDGTPLRVLGCQTEARVRRDAAAAGTPGRWC